MGCLFSKKKQPTQSEDPPLRNVTMNTHRRIKLGVKFGKENSNIEFDVLAGYERHDDTKYDDDEPPEITPPVAALE